MERNAFCGPTIRRTLAPVFSDGNKAQLPAPVSIVDLQTVSAVLEPAHKYALDAKLMAVPAAIDP